MMYGIIALLLASGILTSLTKPSNFAPVPSKRRKKNKQKLGIRDRQIHTNGDHVVVLSPKQESAQQPQERKVSNPGT